MSSKRHKNNKHYNDNIDIAEDTANSDINDLIVNINILIERKDPLIRLIKYPKLLIRGLTDLKNMVEMMDIKHAIVNQIKFLVANGARKEQLGNKTSSSFEGHMLHSVISGNPGTGKTSIAMILAKIWMSLGFVKRSETPVSTHPSSNTLVNTANENHRKRIEELEEIQYANQRKMDYLRDIATKYHTISSDIRRRAIKLKPFSNIPVNEESFTAEWEQFLARTRELRFGFDELIREANTRIITNTSPTGPVQITLSPVEEEPVEEPKFVIAAREDLVAEYLGQTAIKTKKVLESALGGVLFIDEAYSICNLDNGSKDKYGEECLSTINEFMSLHSNEIIIIFAGYKHKLLNSLFTVQPGLMRRIAYFFEIKDYTPKGLVKIFTRQLSKDSWYLSPDIDAEKILTENKDIIRDGGGGTEKLSFYVKIEYGKNKFIETVNSTPDNPVQHNSIITEDMLLSALDRIRGSDVVKPNTVPTHMYM